MNNVFEGQIRKMQELYIDDMIVKSIEESYNLSHLCNTPFSQLKIFI